MEFFDLVNISERYMEIVNPSSEAKIIKLGKCLGLQQGNRVLDVACGYGEALVLWAEQFGINGLGVDIREHACDRAKNKVSMHGLTDSIEIVCANGREYAFEERGYDAVTCIGASFVWGGYRESLRAMKPLVRTGGRVGIGEPYWLHRDVPPEYVVKQPFHSEADLLQIAREEGFDLAYIIRASHDDWDRYEGDNWEGLLRWLEENPDHADRETVRNHFHKKQDEYLTYVREYLGWAIHVLVPKH